MKTGLVSAIVLAVLLLSSLLYWKGRPLRGAAPGEPDRAAVLPPESPGVLSQEAIDPGAAARTTPPPAAIASPVTEPDAASSPPVAVVSASIPENQDARNEVFAEKYAEKSPEARRAALESLRALLEGPREGEVGPGQALTDEQIREAKLEIEWLVLHP